EAEAVRQRVVGIIVETLVFPEPVGIGRYRSGLAAQTAQFRNALIGDLERSQAAGKRFLVVLRIGPRLRNGSYVDDQSDIADPQQADELLQCAGRMTDGVERQPH